eukprot:TRINITY_DN3835_c0_g1_i3.p1 TRINITY_DN3835_c0_g1~~TRINITY_DN3835_c0_g1_i3.p1  ORF type:complete len:236 (-),score=27.73 TRINITY_DN3835_c0_g1_i3:24-731(-)
MSDPTTEVKLIPPAPEPEEIDTSKLSEEALKFLPTWKQKQYELKKMLSMNDELTFDINTNEPPLNYIGGVDISFVKGNDVDACACLTVLKYPSLEVVYVDNQMISLTLPYIPSFLAFREVEFLVPLIEKLKTEKPELIPQMILVDGNGYLHPRGFGLACHLGVLTDIPTVGIGKTLYHVDGLDIKSVKKKFQSECKNSGDCTILTGNSGHIWGAVCIVHVTVTIIIVLEHDRYCA